MNTSSPLRIIHLVSGAGGMYCGSCLHGNTLAAALLRTGHDVTLVPLYTPVRTDEESVHQEQLAFGGLNVFLQEKFSLFRRTPLFVDRWLDRPGLVRWMSRWGGKTDARQLGAMTVSMLRGESGRQRKEVEKLLQVLEGMPQIDVVHLSNALLAGLAGPLREKLNVPVAISLTGEDIFIERLCERYAGETQAELRRCLEHVDALIATNGYFASRMADYLALRREEIHVIPPGIKLAGHVAEREPSTPASEPAPQSDFRIGYFSRVCHDKGLHLLAEALEIVGREAPELGFTLEAAGYLSPADRGYLRDVEKRCEQGPLRGRFHYVGSPDRPGKIGFLQSVDVVCLPAVFPESKGIAAVEAWANGRPVIAPREGAFPELVADTEAGLLFEPGSAESLARKIVRLCTDRRLMAEMGRRGITAVRDRYHDGLLAQRTAELYKRLAAAGPCPAKRAAGEGG